MIREIGTGVQLKKIVLSPLERNILWRIMEPTLVFWFRTSCETTGLGYEI